jgi:hypothetical protein
VRHTAAVAAAVALLVATVGAACSGPSASGTGPASGTGSSGQVPPSRLLSLSNWKLEIPVASGGSDQPEEVNWPALGTYHSQFFHVNKAGSGTVFWANVGGAIIPGSMFARTELRELADNGTRQASWSNVGTTNIMTIREAITHLPAVRPAIVAGQIHDANTYVALIRLDGTRLWVKENNKSAGTLDPDYRLGAIFTVKLAAADDRILVYYNGALKVDFTQVCSRCYFKAGAYLQSNISYGDNPDAYGEVVIYSLDVSHR